MKQIKKIFLFIKKYWFVVATVSGVIIFFLIKLFANTSVKKNEIKQKIEVIKKSNNETIKEVEKEIKQMDEEIEQIKKNRREVIKNKKERDKKAKKYFKGI